MKIEGIKLTDYVGQAIGEITAIKQQISAMGANDYEMPTLDKLIESLEKKEISPKDATEQARMILNNKQDYH